MQMLRSAVRRIVEIRKSERDARLSTRKESQDLSFNINKGSPA